MSRITSFWRGEVPLKAAFWYWGVLVWVIWPIIGTFVSGPMALVELVLYPFYLVFSAVGIIRSAKRYSGNKAFRIGAYIVPIAAALGWVLTTGLAIIFLLRII